MGALMNCHEPPCGMGREDSRPGTGHPGGHTGHPGGMPAGPRTLEDGSPLCVFNEYIEERRYVTQ